MEEPNNKVKTDKLTDKAFLRLVVTSILAIVVCIICLCSSTYAWFMESVPSIENELKMSGACELEVTVTPNIPDSADVANIEDGVVLDAGEYLVVLLLPPNSASGYCLIEAGGNAYYSDYIIGNSDAPQIKSFLLRLESSQLVTFTARWGIYNRNGDVIDGVLTIGDNSILEGIEAPADETEAPADETEAPADETEAPADETEAPAETNENITE